MPLDKTKPKAKTGKVSKVYDHSTFGLGSMTMDQPQSRPPLASSTKLWGPKGFCKVWNSSRLATVAMSVCSVLQAPPICSATLRRSPSDLHQKEIKAVELQKSV